MVRLKYLVEGGNYGFRGPLNRTWLEDRGTHWHQELPGVLPNLLRLGAGSPCGLLVYEGTLLPAKYRGQVFHAEAGKRILAMYTISDRGRRLPGRQRRRAEHGRRHVVASVGRRCGAGRCRVRRRLVRPGRRRSQHGRHGRQSRAHLSPRADWQPSDRSRARSDVRRGTDRRAGVRRTQRASTWPIRRSRPRARRPRRCFRRCGGSAIRSSRARALWMLGGLGADGSARDSGSDEGPGPAIPHPWPCAWRG